MRVSLEHQAEVVGEGAEGERRLLRHYAVSQDAELVGATNPGGSPINHSTNAGLSRRPVVLWDESPGIAVRGAWRPSREFVGTFSEGFAPSL